MNIPVAALLAALCSGRNYAFQSPLSTRAVRRRQHRVAVAVASSVTSEASPLITATVDDAQESSSIEDSSEFNWFKAWYPIVPVEFLDYEKPHAYCYLE